MVEGKKDFIFISCSYEEYEKGYHNIAENYFYRNNYTVKTQWDEELKKINNPLFSLGYFIQVLSTCDYIYFLSEPKTRGVITEKFIAEQYGVKEFKDDNVRKEIDRLIERFKKEGY